MRITLDENYNATLESDTLGYVGENVSRTIYFSGLYIDDADKYSILIGYDNGVYFDEEIGKGEYTIRDSIMKISGTIYCQIVAKKNNGEFVKKSNIFRMKIGKSVDNKNSYRIYQVVDISKKDFDAIKEKSDDILYIVTDDSGNITQYLGSTPIGETGGSAYTSASLYSNVANGVAVSNVTKEDI